MTSIIDLEPMSVVSVSELYRENEQIRGQLKGIRAFAITAVCLGIALTIAYYNFRRDKEKSLVQS